MFSGIYSKTICHTEFYYFEFVMVSWFFRNPIFEQSTLDDTKQSSKVLMEMMEYLNLPSNEISDWPFLQAFINGIWLWYDIVRADAEYWICKESSDVPKLGDC